MRAPGKPQAVFALESHIDELARQLGIDPLALRLKNLIVEGDETASGERFEHVRVHETLKAAADAAGYYAPKPLYVGRGSAARGGTLPHQGHWRESADAGGAGYGQCPGRCCRGAPPRLTDHSGKSVPCPSGRAVSVPGKLGERLRHLGRGKNR